MAECVTAGGALVLANTSGPVPARMRHELLMQSKRLGNRAGLALIKVLSPDLTMQTE